VPAIDDLAPLQVGYSVILSTSDGALLPTFATDSMEDLMRPHIHRLDRGDVAVFRYDCWHAGAAYASGHRFRIHAYLTSKEVKHNPGYVFRARDIDDVRMRDIAVVVEQAVAEL